MAGIAGRSGRKLGSTNLIRIQSLREHLDRECGVPFEVVLAKTAKKFYTDIQNNENLDPASRYLINLGKMVMEQVPKQLAITDGIELTVEERRERIQSLIKKHEEAIDRETLNPVAESKE